MAVLESCGVRPSTTGAMVYLECNHESSGISQENLPQLQSGSSPWCGVRDLFRPQAQAAAGLNALMSLSKGRCGAIIVGYVGFLAGRPSIVSGDR